MPLLQVVKNWEDEREFSQIQKRSMSWIFRNSFYRGGRENFSPVINGMIIKT